MSKQPVQKTIDSFFKKKSEIKKREHDTSDSDEAEQAASNKKPKTPPIIIKKETKNGNQDTKADAIKNKSSISTPNKPPSFLSLENIINDPKCQTFKDDHCICIRDKFPKSKQHYLIIPIDHHNQQYFTHVIDLKKEHIKLLEHLKNVSLALIKSKFEIKSVESYKFGFHSIQSMYPLHMHVITNDFVSECLKTKKHWNSFNTDYFIDLDRIIDHLKKNDTLEDLILPKEQCEKLLKTDLKCNQCSKYLTNMPKLKDHLTGHLKKKEVVVE